MLYSIIMGTQESENRIIQYSGTPLNQPPFGPVKVSFLEGWPHFRGEFVLKSMLWDFLKWPEYRGGHILGVLIRGVPL